MLCTMIMDNFEGFSQGVLSFEVASPLLGGGRHDSVATETSELNTPVTKDIGSDFQFGASVTPNPEGTADLLGLTPQQLAQTIGKSNF